MKQIKAYRGQALPLGIVLILAGMLLSYVMYDSRVLTSDKTRLANAADSAAYSGLVWQSRALNFQAYTNRAMVANQVSIAQFVTLKSWTDYGHQTAYNVNNTIGWIPPFRPFTQAAESAMQTVDNTLGKLAGGAVSVIDGFISVLTFVQDIMYYSAFYATPDIAASIVKKDDAQFEVVSNFAVASMAQNIYQWRGLLHKDKKLDSLYRKRQVIDDSRDNFLKKRDWKLGYIYTSPVSKHKLDREGRTKLEYDVQDDKWNWTAKDTFSLHNKFFRCSWRGCGWKHHEIPIGWGKAAAGQDYDCSRDGGGRCYMPDNRSGERMANKFMDDVIDGYSGPRAFYELKDLSANNKDPRLLLRVEVSKKSEKIRTTNNMDGYGSDEKNGSQVGRNGINGNELAVKNKAAAHNLSSLSTAEVFFQHPKTSSTAKSIKKEYANLFNPYWQVRLKNTSEIANFAAWVAKDTSLANFDASAIKEATKRQYERSKDELDRLQNWDLYRTIYSEQLAQYLAQINMVEDEISILDDQIKAAEKYLENASSHGVSQTDIAAKQQELNELKDKRNQSTVRLSELRNKYNQLQSAEGNLVAIRDALIQQGLVDAGVDASEVDAYLDRINTAKEYYDSVANLDKALANQLKSIGKNILNEQKDRLVEEFKEEIKDAAVNILKNTAMSYVPSEYRDGLKTVGNQAKGYLETTRDELIAMRGQIEAEMANLKNRLGEIEQEVQKAVDSVDQQIEDINEKMLQGPAELKETLEANLEDAKQDLDSLIDNKSEYSEFEFNELKAEMEETIAEIEDNITTAPQELMEKYESKLAELNENKQKMLDGVEAEKQNLLNQIDEHQKELDKIIDALNKGLESI